MRVAVVIAFLFLTAGAGHTQPRNPLYGEPSDFLGTWNNVELRRNMVVRIVIRPDYNKHVRVIVYGISREGEPCVYGEYRGRFYLARQQREREQDNSAVLVKVEREFVHGHVLLRVNGRGEIVSHALLKFVDGDDLYSVDRFAVAERSYRSEGDYGEGYGGPGRPYYRGY